MSAQHCHPFDVLVVGSGPAGTHAADRLVKKGLKVALVDIGHRDGTYGPRIPDRPFWEIRKTDPGQGFYFLGEDHEGVFRNQLQAGAHLTPPRQHMVKDSMSLFPLKSEDFFALLATSAGGLGASWGANCFSFSSGDLARVGLDAATLQPYYDEVAREIGVSADPGSDIAPLISRFEPLQPPLRIDTNASSILARYGSCRESFQKHGFSLGISPLASLTEKLGERMPNAYHDMDFWSDRRQSVYRPAFTLDALKSSGNFTHLPRRLAVRFESLADGARLFAENLESGARETLSAARLIVAAGALNSCRLLAASLDGHDAEFPILCNRNQWIASINLGMLGRPAEDPRHSLSQLTSLMKRAEGLNPDDELIGQFYSYRSLLLFRLLKDIPLPPFLALPIIRLLLTSMTIVNLHYSDAPSPGRSIRIEPGDGARPALRIRFSQTAEREGADRRDLRRYLAQLRRLRVIPLRVTRPQAGASIHYAGTIPMTDSPTPLRCDRDGRCWDAPNVYVGDSSTWRYLPARGLTFTIMANARRVADATAEGLKK